MDAGNECNSRIVPERVMEAVKRTLVNVEELRTNFDEFLSLSDPEVQAEMPPLQRAQSLLLLAKAASTLFTVRLRCNGVHPDDHPIKRELDRLNRYQEKLECFLDLSEGPLRPSTTLNCQAAARFIEHSLPDLTADQRQSMRGIIKGEGRIKYLERTVQKKRKYPSSEKESVKAAAQNFLEKAACELLGENVGRKGPLGPLQPEVIVLDDD